MTEESQNQLCDTVHEMRGLAVTLTAAARGDLQEPDKILEYAASQVERLATLIAAAIRETPEKPTDRGPF